MVQFCHEVNCVCCDMCLIWEIGSLSVWGLKLCGACVFSFEVAFGFVVGVCADVSEKNIF